MAGSSGRVRIATAIPSAAAATATAYSAIFCGRFNSGSVLHPGTRVALPAVGPAHVHARPDLSGVREGQRQRKHVAFPERLLQPDKHDVAAARLERDRHSASYLDGVEALHL